MVAAAQSGIVTLAFVAALGAYAVGQEPTFRAEIDLASFGVTITDRAGIYLTDLTRDDFEVLEDGVPQAVRYFARGEASVGAFAPELHLGLLFDTSGSMVDDIGLARTAAVRFLNTFQEARDMALVDFASEVRIARYGQNDFPRMVERIRTRRPSGETAMYDALGVYLDQASDDEGRTILVLYTDGGDTRSSISFKDVMTLVQASDVTIYVIGLLDHQSTRNRLEQRTRLTQLATASGGEAFFPSGMRDVERAYDKVVSQIRAQYSLAFASTNTKRDGTWRKVEIRVKRPGLRGVRVQTRQGYFAPYQP
ncbi:MAG: VWA domain-containing protein [Vicinamibacterales bacterium]